MDGVAGRHFSEIVAIVQPKMRRMSKSHLEAKIFLT